MITVFTPTYNRAYCLKRLYKSLLVQSNKNFEWLIVDDGSNDGTQMLIEGISAECRDFPIIYHKTLNYGKHHAINEAVRLAKGEYFFIVDSDDYLTMDAIEKIYEMVASLKGQNGFAGVCGLKGNPDGVALGHSFEGEYLDCTYLNCKNYDIWGDKAEVYRTEILKRYPFPVFEGEKFIPESIVWDRIAKDGYKLRYFNAVIYICEYLEDGLSANLASNNAKCPKGSALYLAQSIELGKIHGLDKWNRYNAYWNQFKGRLGYMEIARNLALNPLTFYLKLLGFRIFKRLYCR